MTRPPPGLCPGRTDCTTVPSGCPRRTPPCRSFETLILSLCTGNVCLARQERGWLVLKTYASRLVNLICIAAVLLVSACASDLKSNAAKDYSANPRRIRIIPKYSPIIANKYSEEFLAQLQKSLELCGSTVTMSNPDSAEFKASNMDFDADFYIRSIGYTVTVSSLPTVPRSIDAQKFEAFFVDEPSHRIVWRGTFTVSTVSLSSAEPSRIAPDIVRRLAEDGILKSCPTK
jgi:hypothetical protein